MQEMRAPDGEIYREFAAGKQAEIDAHFARRRAELEQKGYVYVGQGKVRANAQCPCKSGMKFKRCCISRVVRFHGGTFVKGVADLTGLNAE
jgi:uncharacterized protein YchJ